MILIRINIYCPFLTKQLSLQCILSCIKTSFFFKIYNRTQSGNQIVKTRVMSPLKDS